MSTLLRSSVLALALGISTSAAAQTCEPFVAHGAGDTRSVSYINVGDPGPSRGDMRLGGRLLVDDDGNQLGAYSWILTMIDQPDEDGRGTVQIKAYLELAGGQLVLETIVQSTGRLDDTDAVVVRPPIEYDVVGGTGIYETAVGTARLVVVGSDAVFVVDTVCE
ncbi:MAG: hypothetical protein AAF414_12050 [Pseudomonadota bacterium]